MTLRPRRRAAAILANGTFTQRWAAIVVITLPIDFVYAIHVFRGATASFLLMLPLILARNLVEALIMAAAWHWLKRLNGPPGAGRKDAAGADPPS